MSEKKLFTIKEVSQLTGISESEIIRFVMLKEINSIRVGKSIKIEEEDLDLFLKNIIDKQNLNINYSNPIIYSAEQVANILQIAIESVWTLLKNKDIEGFKIKPGRSSWRITSKALNDFILKRTRDSMRNV